LPVRRTVENLHQAEIEDQDLTRAHRARRNRRVRVETHAAEAACRDVGEARVVIDHQD
jgi:hypothetical protein